MRKNCREINYEYTEVPIRHKSKTESDINKYKVKDDVIFTVKTTQKKKVLKIKIKNTSGCMKCYHCGAASEILYVVHKPYCPSCFMESYRA
jgi:formylmethanofuran dehydrogenase subunit E